jgi:hypothetical protein
VRSVWSWRSRRSAVRAAIVVAWLVYAAAVVLTVTSMFPPVGWAPLLAVFLGSPALVHVLWVFVPGYFLQPAVTRIVYPKQVEAQVSRNANQAAASDLPRLPDNLANLPRHTPAAAGSGDVVLQVRTAWDRFLYVAASLSGLPDSQNKRGTKAELSIDAAGLALLIGRWRPGVLFDVQPSSVVGLWNGADLPTIDDRQALVVVIDHAGDQVLLPFSVDSWSDGQSRHFRVDELIERIRIVGGWTDSS